MIRKAEASDVPRIAEIRVFGWRSAYRGIISDEILYKDTLVTTDIQKWAARFDDNDKGFENYVYDDGILKAFLCIGPCPEEDKPGAFELGAIYVDPGFKSQGIGTALANFCEKKAAEGGFREVCLWTFEKNTPTRAFYESLGYKPDGATMIVEAYNAMGVRYSKDITQY